MVSTYVSALLANFPQCVGVEGHHVVDQIGVLLQPRQGAPDLAEHFLAL